MIHSDHRLKRHSITGIKYDRHVLLRLEQPIHTITEQHVEFQSLKKLIQL